jgi:hypothetical protein
MGQTGRAGIKIAAVWCAWSALCVPFAMAQIVPEPRGGVWRVIDERAPMTNARAWADPGEATPRVPAGAIDDPSWVGSRLADLESESWEARERATAELSAAGLTPERAASLAAGVGPEARERLLAASTAWFEGTERAAMGVRFGDRGNFRFEVDEARVGGTIDGFDAQRVLQPNDLILEVNGRPVNYQELRAQIVSHDPGQTCQLTVLRGGRSIKTTLTFGRWSMLNQGNPDVNRLDPRVLARAFSLRAERAGLGAPPPLSLGVTQEDWERLRVGLARRLEEGVAPIADQAPSDEAPGELAAVRQGGNGPVWDGQLEDPTVWKQLSTQDLMQRRREFSIALQTRLAVIQNGGRDADNARVEAEQLMRQLSLIEGELQRRRGVQP